MVAIIVPATMPGGAFQVFGASGGGGPTQVRVTFTQNVGVGSLTIANASIGIQAGSGDAYDTAATPVELKFAGVSGFTLAAGSSITSDWATLAISASTGTVFSSTNNGAESGWTGYTMRDVYPVTGSATPVVVVMDVPGNSAVSYNDTSGITGVATYYKAATASYATADVTGFTGPYGTNRVQAVTLIETQ